MASPLCSAASIAPLLANSVCDTPPVQLLARTIPTHHQVQPSCHAVQCVSQWPRPAAALSHQPHTSKCGSPPGQQQVQHHPRPSARMVPLLSNTQCMWLNMGAHHMVLETQAMMHITVGVYHCSQDHPPAQDTTPSAHLLMLSLDLVLDSDLLSLGRAKGSVAWFRKPCA